MDHLFEGKPLATVAQKRGLTPEEVLAARIWAEIVQELKTEISDWNRRLVPSDGRRIILDEVPDRRLTLTSRAATVTATVSLDGKAISLTVTHHADVSREWQDSVHIQIDEFGRVELQQAGERTSAWQVAFWLLQRVAAP